MNKNILIVGVGGQGTLLASRILGAVAQLQNMECKLSEVHGMSQRGGSVVTHVRIGEKIFSPTIPEGEADVILSFEKLEAARWRHYLKKDGFILCNDQEIMPLMVIIGKVDYPENVLGFVDKENVRLISVNAIEIAKELGNVKAVNVVMLGRLAKLLDIPYETAEQAMALCVKEKFLELNKKALYKGYTLTD